LLAKISYFLKDIIEDIIKDCQNASALTTEELSPAAGLTIPQDSGLFSCSLTPFPVLVTLFWCHSSTPIPIIILASGQSM